MTTRTLRLAHLVVVATLVAAPLTALAQSERQSSAPHWTRLLVQSAGGVSSAELRQLFAEHGLVRRKQFSRIKVHLLRVPSDQADAAAAALRADSRIRSVERDEPIPPAVVGDTTGPPNGSAPPPSIGPNDPDFSAEYHLTRIGCPQAWDSSIGSASVPIAILDSGVDATHPDLAGKLVAGFNVFDNTTDTHDVYGHGTMVAGVAAAASNNGIGITGVAWANPIMPIRITDLNGYAYTSTLTAGLMWAADHGARVANISFAVFGAGSLTAAAQYFAGNGGVTFAAGGNDGIAHTDAANPWVLSVAATDENDLVTSFSSSGPYIDLAAPGVDILTLMAGGGYGTTAGTSFSSPIAAGVAGLLFGVSPLLTPTQIADLLTGNAYDLGPAGFDNASGWGRVDAAASVAAARTLLTSPDMTSPVVAIRSPAGGTTTSGVVSVLANAADNVGVTRVALYADGQVIGTLATAPYKFIWNANTASRGRHSLVAVAYDKAGNRGVSAAVPVNNLGDIVPPSIALTGVVNNAVYRSPGTLVVTANASDNVGIPRVTFYIDSIARALATVRPYTRSFDLSTLTRGGHSLYATATDAAGNTTTSSRIAFSRQ